MPAMLNPSLQLYANMNPSARGQYQGYERARTGDQLTITVSYVENSTY